MTRGEFITICGLLGIGLPFDSCIRRNTTSRQDDNIIIIGAGAAGLTAAHLLKQQGINVTILEANNVYGGRMKRTIDFVDFPVPTGAEWLHTDKKILSNIVNDDSVSIDITTQPYDFDVDYAFVNGERVNLKSLGFGIDQKFIGSTWYDFYDQYIVPNIKDNIKLNQQVIAINYTTETIQVQTTQ